MAAAQERLREAALDLFAERGFHGVGIRLLAERAGLSSASLYHYMGTKEELLASLMRECLERLVVDAEAALAAHADPLAALDALVRSHVASHAERPRETRVVDGEVSALTGATRDDVVALRDRYEELWRQALEGALATSGGATVDPAVLRRALLEMCSGVARWYDPAGPLALEDLAEQYVHLSHRLLGRATPSSEARDHRSGPR